MARQNFIRWTDTNRSAQASKKALPLLLERPPWVLAYVSLAGSALPASRQEIQQAGFERLHLSTGSEMGTC